jgi:Fe/S biogenesis protein NfuA
MIEISQTAQEGLSQALAQSGEFVGLRLVIHGDAPAMYRLEMLGVAEGEQNEQDTVVECGDLKVFLDPHSLPKVEGMKIDAVQTEQGPRLKCDFPPIKWDDPVAQQIQELIDKRINPSLASHNGFVGLLNVNDGTAEMVMGGGCQGCGLSKQTMHEVVEVMIKEEIPQIHTVVDMTDHAMGQNPYYKNN